jgi:cell division protein FtsL
MNNKKSQNKTNNTPSLLKVLWLDLFVRHGVVTALAFLTVGSSMLLTVTTHDSRRLTAQLEQLENEQQVKQVAWESLRLELTSLSEADRLSSLAKEELNMIEVKSHNEKVISL